MPRAGQAAIAAAAGFSSGGAEFFKFDADNLAWDASGLVTSLVNEGSGAGDIDSLSGLTGNLIPSFDGYVALTQAGDGIGLSNSGMDFNGFTALDIRMKLRLSDYINGAVQPLCGQWETGVAEVFKVEINATGNLVLTCSNDGSANTSATSSLTLTAIPGIAAYLEVWLLVQHTFGTNQTDFLYSLDAGDDPTAIAGITALGLQQTTCTELGLFSAPNQPVEFMSGENFTTFTKGNGAVCYIDNALGANSPEVHFNWPTVGDENFQTVGDLSMQAFWHLEGQAFGNSNGNTCLRVAGGVTGETTSGVTLNAPFTCIMAFQMTEADPSADQYLFSAKSNAGEDVSVFYDNSNGNRLTADGGSGGSPVSGPVFDNRWHILWFETEGDGTGYLWISGFQQEQFTFSLGTENLDFVTFFGDIAGGNTSALKLGAIYFWDEVFDGDPTADDVYAALETKYSADDFTPPSFVTNSTVYYDNLVAPQQIGFLEFDQLLNQGVGGNGTANEYNADNALGLGTPFLVPQLSVGVFAGFAGTWSTPGQGVMPTGDFTIEFNAYIDDSFNGIQTLVSHGTVLDINVNASGFIQLYLDDGVNQATATSDATVGSILPDASYGRIRVERQGGNVSFYASTTPRLFFEYPYGGSFTQIGTTQVFSVTGSKVDENADVNIGQRPDTTQQFTGYIGELYVYSDVTQTTPVLLLRLNDFDPYLNNPIGGTLADGLGNTWTQSGATYENFSSQFMMEFDGASGLNASIFAPALGNGAVDTAFQLVMSYRLYQGTFPQDFPLLTDAFSNTSTNTVNITLTNASGHQPNITTDGGSTNLTYTGTTDTGANILCAQVVQGTTRSKLQLIGSQANGLVTGSAGADNGLTYGTIMGLSDESIFAAILTQDICIIDGEYKFDDLLRIGHWMEAKTIS